MIRLKVYRLEVFKTVAQRLNVTRAARQLHVTPPAVSHQISKLEKDLAVKLFVKKRRGVELTETGASVRIDVEAILARLNALEKKYHQ